MSPATEFPATAIGPTWQTDHAGRFILPEHSIGWDGLVWAGQRLQLKAGEPWRFTAEQARWWLWWYAVDERGEFVYGRQAWLQRLKGWGKDPLAAVVLANELVGVSRFGGFRRGAPYAVEEPDAWVQVLAVTQRQTKNTMRVFPRLFTEEAKREYGLQVNKEQIYALGDTRFLEALTSNPEPIEGARTTAVLGNEMQYWRAQNGGHAMFDAVEGNLMKNPNGARFLGIANAFQPGRDSILERTRLAMDASLARPDEVSFDGIMYDSLEAHPKVRLTGDAAADTIERVVESVRGDAVWLKPARIRASVMDPKNPVSESRRKWFNQIVAAEDAWMDPFTWDSNGDASLRLEPRDEVVLFFDGSKSDDATVLVACRVADGALFPLGLWVAPPKARRGEWTAPRGVVSQRVRQAFKDYRVVGFFADPSHTREDGTADLYWKATVDKWHQDFHSKLLIWARPGRDGHSIEFDMSNRHVEGARFVEAAELFVEEADQGNVPHPAHAELSRHVKNARRFPTQHGVSLMKDGRESPRKIDLAVAAVGARMVRRQVMNLATKRGQGRGGVW
ncbi:terminase [Pseudoclavibacter endophyticus]|uniref:Terminase n=1 Tax=Pseudoclavibacter endophyticus TaxID=1778590 RepID=A0A6H9WP68_9MICO|nr:terminase [Pseudoclavibacter endophyticus]KAB1648416.1 terminase [Pseudoclavibacter endophyticus]